MPQIPSHIFGLHDTGGENLILAAGKRGWVVITAKVSDGGGDYSSLANAGLGVIVRLNYGYGSEGTIPPAAQYDSFAQACANFAAHTQGANIWIIGNEPNLAAERPGNTGGNDGQIIMPTQYAQCFAKCNKAIRNVPGHAADWIAPAPVGPWNAQTTYAGNPSGDWVLYYKDVLTQCIKLNAPPNVLALHTYTHGAGGRLISSEQMMNAPFQNYHYHFRAYRDFLSVVPTSLKNLPVLITETQPADPDWWQDRDVGWIQAAYAEISQWNADSNNQAIYALCLFRWQTGDARWSISDKPIVQDAFRAAMQNDYRMPGTTPMPPSPSATGWCPFATKRLITLENFDVGRDDHKVTAVVLHIAAGPMSAVFPTFNNPTRQASAHFCIGKDGTIEQYVSIDDTAYGNGARYKDGQWFNPRGIPVKPSWKGLQPPDNPNWYTISIEHEGQPAEVWTPQMYDANNRLLKWIASQCGLAYIPHQTLIGHYEIDPVDRPNCPGPNVNWVQIATDANASEVPNNLLLTILAQAIQTGGLPINFNAALFQFAQAHKLGCPQTDEFTFRVNNVTYIGQVFNQGIVYVKQGDWGNVQWTNKPNNAPPPTDTIAQAVIAVAKTIQWMPINAESAFFKFATANNVGCPQTDEFEFKANNADYVGQVYALGMVYAKKGDWGNLKWVSKT